MVIQQSLLLVAVVVVVVVGCWLLVVVVVVFVFAVAALDFAGGFCVFVVFVFINFELCGTKHGTMKRTT